MESSKCTHQREGRMYKPLYKVYFKSEIIRCVEAECIVRWLKCIKGKLPQSLICDRVGLSIFNLGII